MMSDIQKLRKAHIDIDREVTNVYGWQDLDLGRDFHPTKQEASTSPSAKWQDAKYSIGCWS